MLPEKPIIIAGPCMAENYEIMATVADSMIRSAELLGFDYYFKSSFDKANRSSINSYRGPGLEQAARWFEKIKNSFGCKILTDIHETHQAKIAAESCDILQIPAFLCRQTDLLASALSTGKPVNIKKGQFMSPEAMQHIAHKAESICQAASLPLNVWLTERGSSFGYGDLIVDMRSFETLAKTGLPVIFDITHSTQKPPANGPDMTSGARKAVAPLLARAALATGYISGFFLEVHPKPPEAKSDAQAQLNPRQASSLLKQLCQLWSVTREILASSDSSWENLT